MCVGGIAHSTRSRDRDTLVEGPDQALDERILPGTARRGHDFLGAKTLHQTTEIRSVATVAIP